MPVGVLTYLLPSGRFKTNGRRLRLTLEVLAVPSVTAIAYLIWFRFVYAR